MMISFTNKALKPKSRKKRPSLLESQILDIFRSGKENELIYLKNGLFKLTDYPNLLKFELNDGKVYSVTQIRSDLINKIIDINKEK